ncbi:MAG: hypothetical protein WA463_07255 [Terriglobales bacterium]
MSIRALYILLVVGVLLVLLAAIAIYLRVRRHMRASSDSRHEMPMGKNS